MIELLPHQDLEHTFALFESFPWEVETIDSQSFFAHPWMILVIIMILITKMIILIMLILIVIIKMLITVIMIKNESDWNTNDDNE